jgi:hypothetical protein
MIGGFHAIQKMNAGAGAKTFLLGLISDRDDGCRRQLSGECIRR